MLQQLGMFLIYFFILYLFINVIFKLVRTESPHDRVHTCRDTHTSSFFTLRHVDWTAALSTLYHEYP